MTFDTTHAELIRQRDAQRRYADQDAANARGVRWSGLGPDPILPASDEVLVERAERLSAEREAWINSPRGKLALAIRELRELSYRDEAERIYGCYRRGFSDTREPVNTAEVIRALKTLDGLPRPIAADCREALYAILADNENVLSNVTAFVREARR